MGAGQMIAHRNLLTSSACVSFYIPCLASSLAYSNRDNYQGHHFVDDEIDSIVRDYLHGFVENLLNVEKDYL